MFHPPHEAGCTGAACSGCATPLHVGQEGTAPTAALCVYVRVWTMIAPDTFPASPGPEGSPGPGPFRRVAAVRAVSTGRHCCPSLEMPSPALGPERWRRSAGWGLRQPGVPRGWQLPRDLALAEAVSGSWPHRLLQIVFHHHPVLSPPPPKHHPPLLGCSLPLGPPAPPLLPRR